MTRFSKVFGMVMVVMFFLSLCGPAALAGKIQQQLVGESTIEKVFKKGILRVGMSTFKPWAMKDKTGKLIGFEIDVATRLAADMGVKLELVPTKWSGIIPALLTGKFDVIIGGMSILTKRNQKVNFTIPYDVTGMSMVANRELAAGFKSLADFNKSDVVISVRLGATPVVAAKKFMPKAELRQFDDESQALQEVLNGKSHAMVASAPLPAQQSVKHPEKLYLPLEDVFTKEPIGFAVRKGDYDTVNFFNNWITIVTMEGWLAEKKHYWFKTLDWEDRIK